MSEYQYYEWQSIDRPLTAEEQAEVNELSSHISVTSTRAVVTYNWGDFKHNPKSVLAHYFDVYLYFANWGCQRLAFRFPKGLLDERLVQPYLWEDCVELEPSGDYLILDISFPNEDGGDWFDGDASLSPLAWLRDDILEGDVRALYLAWLLAAGASDADDEEPEPPVPAGMGDLSPQLTEFARFFHLDRYLVQAAALASEPLRATPRIVLEEALARLPRAECDAFLLRLAQGEPHLALKLNRRLEELSGVRRDLPAGARRSWGELQATAKRLREEEERKRREAAEARRIQELQELAPRQAQTWRKVRTLVEEKQARPYDEAVVLLRKLRDLAVYQGRLPAFEEKLAELREQCAKRPALLSRLQKAGL